MIARDPLGDLLRESVKELSADAHGGEPTTAPSTETGVEVVIYLLDTDLLIYMVRGLEIDAGTSGISSLSPAHCVERLPETLRPRAIPWDCPP